jgi:hypothetical protein
MRRWGTLGLRLVIVALLLVVAAYGSMWAYVGYEAHRARIMLTEVSQVHLGDPEISILPLVQRYVGFKWTPEPLPPREDWLDKDEYDYQKIRVSDYKYEIEISPFETVVHRTNRLTQALRAVRATVPAHLRPVLGMRDWSTVAVLSVRGSRVQSVSAMTLVESRRSRWVGHSWELADGMPQHDMHQRLYAVGAEFLTMPGGGEMMIENYFTPKSPEEEARTARQFNTGCLTSMKGCDGLCDVAPRAIEYVKQHPDAAWNIIPPKCP